MKTQKYQELAGRTCATTEPTETLKLTLIGMQGELGEIAEPVKKYLYGGHELEISHLEQEVGDFLWYLANFCNTVGIDLECAMQRNVEKLARRYPDGFSQERSINRANYEPYREGAEVSHRGDTDWGYGADDGHWEAEGWA